MAEKRLFAVDLGASGGKCFIGFFGDGSFRMEEVHRFAHEGVSYFLPDRTGALASGNSCPAPRTSELRGIPL